MDYGPKQKLWIVKKGNGNGDCVLRKSNGDAHELRYLKDKPIEHTYLPVTLMPGDKISGIRKSQDRFLWGLWRELYDTYQCLHGIQKGQVISILIQPGEFGEQTEPGEYSFLANGMRITPLFNLKDKNQLEPIHH